MPYRNPDPDKTKITFTDETWQHIAATLEGRTYDKAFGVDAAEVIRARVACNTIHCDECNKELDEEETLTCFRLDAEACYCKEHS